MATRIVRGEFNDSRSMSSVSLLAELTFLKLILACDDFGRMDGRPSVLKARLFPARSSISQAKVAAAVCELADEGCVWLYEMDGSPYLQLVNWEKHRGKGRRATVSKYPDPEPGERTEGIRGDPRKSEEMTGNPPEGYRGMGVYGYMGNWTGGSVKGDGKSPSAKTPRGKDPKVSIPALAEWPTDVCEAICKQRGATPQHLRHALKKLTVWHEAGDTPAARVKRTIQRWHIYLRDQEWPWEGFGNGAARGRRDPDSNYTPPPVSKNFAALADHVLGGQK